jgi:competence protein ComGC
MKPRLSSKRTAGMTLFEVGVVIAVVMILMILLLPPILSKRHGSHRIGCANNLKQIGLAYRIWAGDNGDIYPMGISVTNGGSMEMAATGNVGQTFLVMSNELSTPKILVCPQASNPKWAANFGELANFNISYFIGVDATNPVNPQMIISGDCNFEIGGVAFKPGLRELATNAPVAWSATRHVKAGNLGLADGSVQSTTTSQLRYYFQQTSLATNRLAIP